MVRDAITSVENSNLTLVSRTTLNTKPIVFTAGFAPTIPLFSENLTAMRLGITSTKYTEEYLKKWTELETEAEKKVSESNPILYTAPKPPPYFLHDPDFGKLRLYHCVIITDSGL
ncbi:hypothetical protein TWF730_000881 [Orbilia blumenaviensis]|uniref:Uncharacterized protein n=1 Tax=Orbilia blumenaviensis TaxID=1796055 RepID=A0AAV9VPZ4_9PEZI